MFPICFLWRSYLLNTKSRSWQLQFDLTVQTINANSLKHNNSSLIYILCSAKMYLCLMALQYILPSCHHFMEVGEFFKDRSLHNAHVNIFHALVLVQCFSTLQTIIFVKTGVFQGQERRVQRKQLVFKKNILCLLCICAVISVATPLQIYD